MTKLFIEAKPNAKKEKVEKIDSPSLKLRRAGETHFAVAVKEPPVQGRANAAIIRALADFLGIAPSRLRIIAGWTSRRKTIEVL
jgi:uncharacterized protein YggU (UPF0235/DUF167 family)